MEEKMSQMMDKLPELLNKLGNKLGVASAKIWEWAMLDVKVDFWQWIMWMLLWLSSIVICIICIKISNKKRIPIIEKKNYDRTFAESDKLKFLDFLRIYSLILIVFFVIFTFICVNSIIGLDINPEWYAFQNIMNQLNNLK